MPGLFHEHQGAGVNQTVRKEKRRMRWGGGVESEAIWASKVAVRMLALSDLRKMGAMGGCGAGEECGPA